MSRGRHTKMYSIAHTFPRTVTGAIEPGIGFIRVMSLFLAENSLEQLRVQHSCKITISR